MPQLTENPCFLSRQLITCIGNKRSLLGFLDLAVQKVKSRLGKAKIDIGDFFAGSGVVSRYMKSHARRLVTNDLELYAAVSARCYLANAEELDIDGIGKILEAVRPDVEADKEGGFITDLYAPEDDHHIRPGERVFYTRRNAQYLDAACRMIAGQPDWIRPFLLGPLLSGASVHANTSGVFKGYYKDERGVGCFGGRKGDALERIKGDISLALPVWSNFSCETFIYQMDANELARKVPPLDLIYLDPPYNQHPYGSNYFMLNLIADYKKPEQISAVSGIPNDWNRSSYNSRREASAQLFDLIRNCQASHVLVSYNSEGYVPHDKFLSLMRSLGELTVWETNYNAFRGSRNLRSRPIKVKEYLYLLERA